MPTRQGGAEKMAAEASRKRKMKENLSPKSPTSPQIKIKNRYTPLSNINDNVEITDNTLADIDNTHSEVRKIPPIFVHNITNYEQFHLSLASVANDDFTIEQKKDSLKLKLTTIDDYRTVTKELETMQIQYHTYQLPEDKRLSVVIRNLPVSISEETIFSALWELQYEVISVTRLQNYLKVPIPIVAVLLPQSSKHIYSLDRLLHCIVSVEPRKPSTDIPQCKNCQRYSHTEKYCHLPPRCVKCAENHHYKNCTKTSDTAAKCVNCEGNHPSSYKGCSYYKDLRKNISKNLKKPHEKTSYSNHVNNINQNKNLTSEVNFNNITTSKVNTNKSYATATNTKSKSSETRTQNIDNDFLKSLMPLINSFISQLMKQIIDNLPSILNNLSINCNELP